MQNMFIRPSINRQPQQAAGIDLSHPLAKDLAMFINPGAGNYDIRSRRSGAFNGTFRRASQPGVGIMATANSSVGSAFTSSPMRTSTANGLGDFTYLVIAAPVASSTREFFVVSQNGSTEFYFGANVNVGLTATSGMVSAQTNSGGASGVQAASAVDGKPHVFVYTRKINGASGDGALYRDGVLLGSGIVNMVQMWSSASSDYVAGYSASGWGVSGPVSLVLGWNRALSPAEVAQISTNPYQLLAMQSRQITLSPAAAADVTGTFASALDGGVMAAYGLVDDRGSFASTLAGATMAATGAVGLVPSGAFASTLDGFTMAAAGQVVDAGIFAAQMGGMTMAASGTVAAQVTGTFASTLGNATMASSGYVGTPPIATGTTTRRRLRPRFVPQQGA